jgi:hypothetical protein
MNNRDRAEATARLADAIQFRQAAGNRWYPDLLVDRHAIALTGVKWEPQRSEDETLTMFSGVAFCQFNTPPQGRNSEAKATVASSPRAPSIACLDSRQRRPERQGRRAGRPDCRATRRPGIPEVAEVLDTAKEILKRLTSPIL